MFIPLLPLASIRDEEMQAVAARTVPLVEERHLPHIEASLWQQWHGLEENYMPYTDQPATKVFEEFLMDTYFPCMDQIIAHMGALAIPKVEVSVNASGEELLRRQTMLSRVSKQDLKVVEDEVRKQWMQQSSQLPSKFRAKRPQEPPQKYWEKTPLSSAVFFVWR